MSGYSISQLNYCCQRLTRLLTTIPLQGVSVQFQHCCAAQSPAGTVIAPHTHNWYEAHLFFSGTVSYSYDSTLPVGAGSLVLHPPQVTHGFVAHEEYQCLVLFFQLDPPLPVPPPTAWPVRADVIAEMDRCLQEILQARPRWRDRVQARMRIIFSELLELATWEDTPEAHTSSLVAHVEVFLHQHLGEPILLQQIADTIGLSSRHLTRCYRKETGRSIWHTLMHMRMERAHHLLQSTDWPINRIAEEVGITEPAYFTRCFRKYFLTTPQSIRNHD